MNDYYNIPDPLEIPRAEPEALKECPHLTQGKRCGKPLKDRSQSNIAGAEKCLEHSRMPKIGIRI